MILDGDLLPATQHYTLLAIATALFAATVVNRQRTPRPFWVWLAGVVGLVPILHMEMSVVSAMSHPWSWTDGSLLLHGLAIGLVVPITVKLALERRSPKTRRKPRLEPKVLP